jgi:hypothetical protein
MAIKRLTICVICVTTDKPFWLRQFNPHQIVHLFPLGASPKLVAPPALNG